MSHHDGVSCDSCLKNNFRGKRYKCLICFDYDLCAACHDSGTLSGRHTSDHPMQCILTRSDLDLFFAGEILTNDQPKSFTCPLCGRLGFTDTSLYEHVNVSHSDTATEVVCPICATLPGGDPNQVTDDFLSHLNVEHRNRESIYEEPQIIRIRNRHNNPNNHSRLNNNRSRRSQIFNATSTRDNIDPIAQLLTQLSDVRRINNGAASTGGVGATGGGPNSMQFHFERQSAGGATAAATGSNRIPLERIIQRQRRQTSQSSQSITSTLAATSHAESILSSQLPYMVLLDSTTSPSFGAGGPTATASLTSNPNQSGAAGVTQLTKTTAPNFLLAKSSSLPSSSVENERKALDVMKADRSIFLQELIFASLSEGTPIDQLVSLKSPTVEEVKHGSSISPSGVESSAVATTVEEPKVSDSVAPSDESLLPNGSATQKSSSLEEELQYRELSANDDSTNNHENENGDGQEEEEETDEIEPSRCSDRVSNHHMDHVRCVEVIGGTTVADSVQSLPALYSGPSPLYVSPPPTGLGGHVNQRGKTQSKVRSPSGGSNRAPLTLRSSFPGTGPNLTSMVVSPNGGRKKVLKHPTEPPTN